jgi:hypothetical protein
MRLLALAQAWLDLADYEERVRDLGVDKPKDISDGKHAAKDAQWQSLG